MAKKPEYYKGLATRLMNADRERDMAFQAYRNMYRGEWALPAGMPRFTRKVVDQSPHDAVQAGVRTLASNYPKVTIYPPRDLPEQKAQANEWEKVLKWHLMSADRRRPVGVVTDTVLSALLYHAVALMVVDLDHQLEQIKAVEADDTRIKALRRHSKFVINTYNPMDVHTLRSSYGTEAVLLCQERLASEVVAEWGKAAGAVMKKLADDGEWVKYYDYMDYTDRCVWAASGKGDSMDIISPKEHGLDFLPWVALMGGSTLEDREADKYHPMLYALHKTGLFDNINILKSVILTDEAIKPWKTDMVIEGEGVAYDEPVERDFEDPDGLMILPAGKTARPIARQGLDPGKNELIAQMQAEIGRTTVPSVLQSGDTLSGESYAGLNMRVQVAMGALKPGKELAEKALAEMFSLMLLWTAKGEKPLNARGVDKRTDLGMQYEIDPETIDTENIYITVELKPDNPTDRVQQANAGMILQQLGYPKEYVLEQVGVEDPQAAMKQFWIERLKEARIQNIIDLERMQMEQGMAQQAQDAQMAQQQEAQMLAQQQQMQGPIQGGPGFNTGMGGMPPAMAFPQGTREELAGEDMFGEAMVGMEGL